MFPSAFEGQFVSEKWCWTLYLKVNEANKFNDGCCFVFTVRRVFSQCRGVWGCAVVFGSRSYFGICTLISIWWCIVANQQLHDSWQFDSVSFVTAWRGGDVALHHFNWSSRCSFGVDFASIFVCLHRITLSLLHWYIARYYNVCIWLAVYTCIYLLYFALLCLFCVDQCWFLSQIVQIAHLGEYCSGHAWWVFGDFGIPYAPKEAPGGTYSFMWWLLAIADLYHLGAVHVGHCLWVELE